MSAFLGHIHYWLFNKIRRVIEREQIVYAKAEAMCGSTAEELRAQAWQSYGEPLADVDLIDVIDQSNIHGWLQRQINIAETREATFIKELLDSCSDAGKDVVSQAFAEHGAICGEHAKAQGKYNAEGADGIYRALQDYYLNGMPCDQADEVVESSSDKVVWQGAECLQASNWKRAGIPAAVMTGFYQNWLAGFVKAMNNDFTYQQVSDITKGDSVNKHQIAR
ncbi:hypothetical protein [Dendrosporobacter sp. 1207_IL3150]|uniref:hypothetical protein n=1 Tax=Dendrosporobacter sp. 1207_IL3150 TaxID=3084054 RepID=UPI002FDB1971